MVFGKHRVIQPVVENSLQNNENRSSCIVAVVSRAYVQL
jgi:hypothetical protein